MNEPNDELPASSGPGSRTCWLHVGMHKTGSTSIQENLAAIKDPQGWRYVTVVDGANMGQALYSMFATRPHEFHWFKKQGKTAEQVAKRGARLRAKLAKTLASHAGHDVIISAEALSLMDRRGIAALKRFLTPHFGTIKVTAYVRAPEGFMNSAFQQQLKHGKARFHFGGVRPKYRRRFQKFDQVFGRENVILRKFDPPSFPNGCIVEDFCRMLGIQGPPPGSVRRVNESLCREACGILFAYRKFGPGFGVGRTVVRENNWIVGSLAAMNGRKFVVSDAVLRKFIRAKDRRWMEKRLGASIGDAPVAASDAVASEGDLLTIRRTSCMEFAARFREIHGARIPWWRIPMGDPVDPRKVAGMVDYCRRIARNRLRIADGNPGLDPRSWKSVILRFPPARMGIRWVEGKIQALRGGRAAVPKGDESAEPAPDRRSAR